MCVFFFSSRRRHTRCSRDWSSDVCSSDLLPLADISVALGVPKSTLLNSLRPLVSDDFLVVEGVLYRLGPRAFRLAATISSEERRVGKGCSSRWSPYQ